MRKKWAMPWWMIVAFTAIMIPLFLSHARAQDTATSRDLLTKTGKGSITLQLLVYDTAPVDLDDYVDDPETYASFEDCNALALADLALFPPWGDFPYGLWQSKIALSQEFDPNVHRIVMKVYFPGQINPLNAQYLTQEYDVEEVVEERRIVWRELEFVPDIDEQSVSIHLKDLRPSSLQGVFISGLGDRDPNERIIDHVGGLLWPIPAGGRCFIENALPRNRHMPHVSYHTSLKEVLGARLWTAPTTSSNR
ncbi:MAG: hypothetical protein ACMUIL_13610 [bacterium]